MSPRWPRVGKRDDVPGWGVPSPNKFAKRTRLGEGRECEPPAEMSYQLQEGYHEEPPYAAGAGSVSVTV